MGACVGGARRRQRPHEQPALPGLAFFFGVRLNVGDGPRNIFRLVEKHLPPAVRPHGRPVGGPKALGGEALGGAGLQVPDDAPDAALVAGDHQVHVLGHDRAGSGPIAALFAGLPEAVRHGEGLAAGELDRRELQGPFGLPAQALIVLGRRQRPRHVDLRGLAEAHEFPAADEVRPRASRVVREPETIRAEDDVPGQGHCAPPNKRTRPLKWAANQEAT